MPYLYLLITALASTAVNVLGKVFHKKNTSGYDGTPIYTFLLLGSAFVCWSATFAFDFSFDSGVLLYSLLFALFFTAGHVGIVGAMQCGPATLTSLFIGLSLLIPTVWGFFFWNAEFTVLVGMGLLLVAISIFLCLYTQQKSETSFSPRWFFFIALATLGNAGCTIVQKQQQMNFNGEHGTMLMFFALLFSLPLYFLVYLKSERKGDAVILKEAWWIPALAGISNTLLNLFVILLASSELSPNLIYPVIGVGSLAAVTVFSLFVFKERMRWWQWVGVGIGAVAVALLSL